jgi:hypothetical protein
MLFDFLILNYNLTYFLRKVTKKRISIAEHNEVVCQKKFLWEGYGGRWLLRNEVFRNFYSSLIKSGRMKMEGNERKFDIMEMLREMRGVF